MTKRDEISQLVWRQKNFVSMVPATKFLYYPLKIDMLAERIELPSSGYKADVIAIIRKPAFEI